MNMSAKNAIAEKVIFRDAGLLDIPFIIEEVVKGAETFNFNDDFVTCFSQINLFKYLFRVVLNRRLHKHQYPQIIIAEVGSEAVAAAIINIDNYEEIVLEVMVTNSQWRNKGIGHILLRHVEENFSSTKVIKVETTPYSKSMIHLLHKEGYQLKKKAKFKNEKMQRPNKFEKKVNIA